MNIAVKKRLARLNNRSPYRPRFYRFTRLDRSILRGHPLSLERTVAMLEFDIRWDRKSVHWQLRSGDRAQVAFSRAVLHKRQEDLRRYRWLVKEQEKDG
jgi:hypothetical protein